MDLELCQRQGLTLAMQTSMRILQLNNLQLRNYLRDLMTRNAVIELEYPDIDCRPGPFDRHSTGSSNRMPDTASTVSKDQLIANQAHHISARQDLFLQCAGLRLSRPFQQVLEYLINSLDENGFLHESPQIIADDIGVSADTVVRCITLLQRMEPAGVGARDLKDCLRIQLLRIAPNQRLALQIIDHYLTELSRQQYSYIAKALQVSKNQVAQACDLIRRLNPKPLNGLGGESETLYIIPDFYIVEDTGTLRLIMNDYYLPKIKVDPTYRDLLRNKQLSPDDSIYIQKSYREVSDVIQFLDYRKATLQRVVEYIIQAQASFFRNGPGYRKSMTNREIAQALCLHESTISRAVSEKFFECKWGVFSLKSLFSHSSTKNAEPEDSADQVMHRIQALIASEPAGKAYSDQYLSELLTGKGFPIARRTVAKYRQALHIPTASVRNRTTQT